MTSADYNLYMSRCLQLASYGIDSARPNPMVGAVIVCDGRIIGEGFHLQAGSPHAEVNAINSVSHTDEDLLSRSTLFVSLEPCAHYGKTPPCADLIIKKHIPQVVVGCRDSFAKVNGEGIRKMKEAGIDVIEGVMEKECRYINRYFFTYHRLQRPYITLKWAQTANDLLDDNGKTARLSSPFTQLLVHRLRSENDAIVVGRVTDEREHPQLNNRFWHGPSPHRYVLSSEMTIDGILADCKKRNFQSLIVEGGCKTLQAFIDRGMYDCIRREIAPIVFTEGTKAPMMPNDVQIKSSEIIDGRRIEIATR